jgi:hypothetical protein
MCTYSLSPGVLHVERVVVPAVQRYDHHALARLHRRAHIHAKLVANGQQGEELAEGVGEDPILQAGAQPPATTDDTSGTTITNSTYSTRSTHVRRYFTILAYRKDSIKLTSSKLVRSRLPQRAAAKTACKQQYK